MIGVLNVSVAPFVAVVAAFGALLPLLVFVAGLAGPDCAALVDAVFAGGDWGEGAFRCAAALDFDFASACCTDLGGFTSLNDVPHISHSQAVMGLDEPHAGQRLCDLDVFVMASFTNIQQSPAPFLISTGVFRCECITCI